jgi:hypothetical protein
MSVFTKVFDDTTVTPGFTRDAGITTMQDEPVVRIEFELVGYQFE